MLEFRITIIQGEQRIERRIIANNSISAAVTGLAMIGNTDAALTIFCQPLERIAKWQPDIAA